MLFLLLYIRRIVGHEQIYPVEWTHDGNYHFVEPRV